MGKQISVRTQDHFKEKIRRNLDPLIEEQKLLVRQYITTMTNKAVKKLAAKIGAQKIVDALREAEDNLRAAQETAKTFFGKKATSKDKKQELMYKFESRNDTITAEDCEEQLTIWAKGLAEKEAEKLPEGKKLAELKRIKRVAEDSVMEADAPSELVAALDQTFQKTLNISWKETPQRVQISR